MPHGTLRCPTSRGATKLMTRTRHCRSRPVARRRRSMAGIVVVMPRDARTEEPTDDEPLHGPRYQPAAGSTSRVVTPPPEAPERFGGRKNSRLAPFPGFDHRASSARWLPVVDIPQQIGEGQSIELCVAKRQFLTSPDDQLDPVASIGEIDIALALAQHLFVRSIPTILASVRSASWSVTRPCRRRHRAPTVAGRNDAVDHGLAPAPVLTHGGVRPMRHNASVVA